MTYCKEFSALLDPYIDGELSPEETARVREHLHTCDGCRAYVQAALSDESYMQSDCCKSD